MGFKVLNVQGFKTFKSFKSFKRFRVSELQTFESYKFKKCRNTHFRYFQVLRFSDLQQNMFGNGFGIFLDVKILLQHIREPRSNKCRNPKLPKNTIISRR